MNKYFFIIVMVFLYSKPVISDEVVDIIDSEGNITYVIKCKNKNTNKAIYLENGRYVINAERSFLTLENSIKELCSKA